MLQEQCCQGNNSRLAGNAIVAVGSGIGGRSQNMSGLQRGESDHVEKGLGEDEAHRVETLVGARDDRRLTVTRVPAESYLADSTNGNAWFEVQKRVRGVGESDDRGSSRHSSSEP